MTTWHVWTHPKLKLKERFWIYPKGEWMEYPRFPRWRRWVPYWGEDERAYRTLVLPLPLKGNVVIAYRKCHDPECMESAAEYAELAARFEKGEE